MDAKNLSRANIKFLKTYHENGPHLKTIAKDAFEGVVKTRSTHLNYILDKVIKWYSERPALTSILMDDIRHYSHKENAGLVLPMFSYSSVTRQTTDSSKSCIVFKRKIVDGYEKSTENYGHFMYYSAILSKDLGFGVDMCLLYDVLALNQNDDDIKIVISDTLGNFSDTFPRSMYDWATSFDCIVSADAMKKTISLVRDAIYTIMSVPAKSIPRTSAEGEDLYNSKRDILYILHELDKTYGDAITGKYKAEDYLATTGSIRNRICIIASVAISAYRDACRKITDSMTAYTDSFGKCESSMRITWSSFIKYIPTISGDASIFCNPNKNYRNPHTEFVNLFGGHFLHKEDNMVWMYNTISKFSIVVDSKSATQDNVSHWALRVLCCNNDNALPNPSPATLNKDWYQWRYEPAECFVVGFRLIHQDQNYEDELPSFIRKNPAISKSPTVDAEYRKCQAELSKYKKTKTKFISKINEEESDTSVLTPNTSRRRGGPYSSISSSVIKVIDGHKDKTMTNLYNRLTLECSVQFCKLYDDTRERPFQLASFNIRQPGVRRTTKKSTEQNTPASAAGKKRKLNESDTKDNRKRRKSGEDDEDSMIVEDEAEEAEEDEEGEEEEEEEEEEDEDEDIHKNSKPNTSLNNRRITNTTSTSKDKKNNSSKNNKKNNKRGASSSGSGNRRPRTYRDIIIAKRRDFRSNLCSKRIVLDGVEYKSKLEARWYKAFNNLGILKDMGPDTQNYECTTYDLLNGHTYTPDFRIELNFYKKSSDGNTPPVKKKCDIIVEIKPCNPYESEKEKCKRLCCIENVPVLLLYGEPKSPLSPLPIKGLPPTYTHNSGARGILFIPSTTKKSQEEEEENEDDDEDEDDDDYNNNNQKKIKVNKKECKDALLNNVATWIVKTVNGGSSNDARSLEMISHMEKDITNLCNKRGYIEMDSFTFGVCKKCSCVGLCKMDYPYIMYPCNHTYMHYSENVLHEKIKKAYTKSKIV